MKVASAPIRSAAQACLLQDAAGRTERCPGRRCPFWEEGSAVLQPGCLPERVLGGGQWTPDLAHRWLRLRAAIVEGSDVEVRRLFHLLPRN